MVPERPQRSLRKFCGGLRHAIRRKLFHLSFLESSKNLFCPIAALCTLSFHQRNRTRSWFVTAKAVLTTSLAPARRVLCVDSHIGRFKDYCGELREKVRPPSSAPHLLSAHGVNLKFQLIVRTPCEVLHIENHLQKTKNFARSHCLKFHLIRVQYWARKRPPPNASAKCSTARKKVNTMIPFYSVGPQRRSQLMKI